MLIRSSQIRTVADEAHGEACNLKTYERVVNLKMKKFLLDFQLARGFERSVVDHSRNRFDIRSGWTIAGESRHERSHACERATERRGGRERREEIDRLARAENFHGDYAGRELQSAISLQCRPHAHADVIFSIRRCRDRIDARRVCERL